MELLPETCYRAVVTRDEGFDGRFYVGVTSTGVYCRPVCKSRTPRAENCRFFSSPEEAEAAGFRACKRCRPRGLDQATTRRPVLFSVTASPVGDLLLTSNGDALTGVAFSPFDDPSPDVLYRRDDSALRAAREHLAAYFEGELREFDLPVLDRGTPFQTAVRSVLRTIPYGETWSYAEVARRVGSPAAVRAVGGAVGSNPLAVVIPCHRVVGSNGSLTGFGGGLERKKWLLGLEGVELDRAEKRVVERPGVALRMD
jgi:methylated-DNA-[protein]-cysteine S-methyltransferase